MLEEFEALIFNKNTSENVRTLIEQKPDLREAICDSMAPEKIALNQRFQSMKIKGEAIEVGVPATEAEMTELFSHSASIEPSLECDRLTKEDLKKATALQSFFEKHCIPHITSFKLGNAQTNHATTVCSTQFGFQLKCFVSSLSSFYHYWMRVKSIIGNLLMSLGKLPMKTIVHLTFQLPPIRQSIETENIRCYTHESQGQSSSLLWRVPQA